MQALSLSGDIKRMLKQGGQITYVQGHAWTKPEHFEMLNIKTNNRAAQEGVMWTHKVE